MIPPFDHEDVIAGQGTIGMEILRQVRGPVGSIFVPVGGGGLIAGVASYVKALRPEIKIIGVEAEGSAGMTEALRAGRRIKLPAQTLDQFADGTAVRQVGAKPFNIARRLVDEMVTVSIDEICAAIRDIFEDTRVISEPAGALAVAGLKKWVGLKPDAAEGQDIAIVSGANINFDRLRHISERTSFGAKTELLLGVTIPEKPGSFLAFCKTLGRQNITEFNYRYSGEGDAKVLVGIETGGSEDERRPLLKRLTKRYLVTELSDNELAVLHVRHMVGGRSPTLGLKAYTGSSSRTAGCAIEFSRGVGR